MCKEIRQKIEKCTVYKEEGQREQFQKYKPRDVRDRNGVLVVEMPSEEMVIKVKQEVQGVYTNEEWKECQREVSKIKEDIQKLKMMEQTTEMMRDDDSNFVRVNFAKPLSKADFKILLAKVGVNPSYIDHLGLKSTLRFKDKIHAEFCVKQLMDAKWNEKKKTPKMFKAMPLEGSCENGIQQVAEVIKNIELLTQSETEEYQKIIEKERLKYKKFKNYKPKKNKK